MMQLLLAVVDDKTVMGRVVVVQRTVMGRAVVVSGVGPVVLWAEQRLLLVVVGYRGLVNCSQDKMVLAVNYLLVIDLL